MSFKIEKPQGTYTVEKMQKTASIASTADGLRIEGNNFKLVNFQACPDMLLYSCELIKDLEKQLVKANEMISECWSLVGNDIDSKSTLPEHVNALSERVRELEKEIKESDDDLYVTQQQSSSYESALEEIQAVFVDSDACPLFEPFDAKNLSNWLNKFAIEKKIEAIENFVHPYTQGLTKEYVNGGYGSEVLKAAKAEIEQLRKEQSNG